MELITPTTSKYLKRVFLFSRLFHFNPFVWDTAGRKPKRIQSPYALCLWYLNVGLTFGYYGFIVYRCLQVNANDQSKPSQKIYMQFAVVYYAYPVLFQVSNLINQYDLPGCVHKYLRFFKHCEVNILAVEFDHKELPLSKRCGKFMVFLFFAFYGNAFFVVCNSFFRPWSPELLSSLIPNLRELGLLARIPFVAFQAYFMITYIETALMYIFCVFGFLLPGLDMAAVLRELTQLTAPITARRLSELFHLFTALHLQLDLFNRVYMVTLTGSKILLVLFSVFCTYGAIRLHGILAISLGWIGTSCTIFLLVTMNTLAEFNSRSSKARELFARQIAKVGRDEGRIWLVKKVTSMKEFRVRIGSAYHIDKSIVMTVCKIIFDSTINFLLANE